MDFNRFSQLPIMGILRGIEESTIESLSQVIISSGLKTIEITMNTPDAPRLIRNMSKAAGGQFDVGAGTVLTMEDLGRALDAGASFIVLPNLILDIVDYCVKNKIPVFPGALTPREIYEAWCEGATMVKVFPAKVFGPAYFREIKGPFQNIKLLACGGVSADNVSEFFSCGASAAAFGASIFKPQWIKDRKFSHIEKSIESLITAFKTGLVNIDRKRS